jgi:hypothetical protein
MLSQAAALGRQLLQAGLLLTDMKGELTATHWRQPPRARYWLADLHLSATDAAVSLALSFCQCHWLVRDPEGTAWTLQIWLPCWSNTSGWWKLTSQGWQASEAAAASSSAAAAVAIFGQPAAAIWEAAARRQQFGIQPHW